MACYDGRYHLWVRVTTATTMFGWYRLRCLDCNTKKWKKA